ncbi:lysophospholipid acyltransferase family protein [soil metagenome]|jgi:chlorobactene lauroyltransferase|nr:1-acyl-sn-glycerol-3-phosphate acyltransferase [Acidobacteriota bacterium]
MLEAKKSAWFETIFSIYNRNLLKRRFHSLQVSGLDFLRDKNAEIPFIIYANHSSWWDGLIAFEISRKAKLDSFIMMEEKQLKNLFLFRKLGAFSVVRENPRTAVESVNYAANLLKKTDRTLWIFPQGEISPNDARPLKFYNGLSRIIGKIGEVFVISLAMRYEFLGEFKPQIFVKIGSPELFKTSSDCKSKKMTEIMKSRLTNLLDELKTDITSKNFSKFKRII